MNVWMSILENAKTLPNDSVMLVGHNPPINYLAEYLSDADIGHMYTGSCAVVKFELESWSEVTQNGGVLEEYVIAKKLDI